MASFLPNLDGLQKILKSDTTFKEKLEMAKMGKSRQLAEQYLPILSQAKNIDEATEIQQALITEAAKYELGDLASRVGNMYEAKKYQLSEKKENEKAKAKFNTLVGTYANVNIFNQYRKQNTNGIQFMNDWFEYNQSKGIDPLGAVDSLENALKLNLFETETETATIDNNIILVRKAGKTKLGNEAKGNILAYKYDVKNNIIYDDKNNNNVADEGELASADVLMDSKVQEQTKQLYSKWQKEIDNNVAQQGIAATYAGIAESAQNRAFQQGLASKVDVSFVMGARELSQGIQTLKGAKFSAGGQMKGTKSWVLGNITGKDKNGKIVDQNRAILAAKYGITEGDINLISGYDPTNVLDKTTGEYSTKIDAYFNTVDKIRKFLVEYSNIFTAGTTQKEFSVLAEQLDYAVKVYQNGMTPGKGLATNVYEPVTVWGKDAMSADKDGNPKDQGKINQWVAETNKGNQRKLLESEGYNFSGSEVKWDFNSVKR